MGSTISSILHIDKCNCGYDNEEVFEILDTITQTLTEMHTTLNYLEDDTSSEFASMKLTIHELKSSLEGILTLIIERALPITPIPSPERTPRNSVDEKEFTDSKHVQSEQP